MADIDYSEFFPETGWICPYCIDGVDENEVKFDRQDIPMHLVYQHEWVNDKDLTWESIYNRLSVVGGV